MAHTTYTDFRQNLAEHMDTVCGSRAPLTVTRRRGGSVVVLAKDAYDSIMETLHLMSSRANVDHLFRSMAAIEAGDVVERDLIE